MNLQQLIEQYIAFRKSLGELQGTNADSLRKFGRSIGVEADIADVREDQVAAFVTGTAPVTRSWHHRFSVVRTFYRYAVSRHYVAAAPLPKVIPKRPPPFVPYIYTHDDLRRLLQAVAGDQRHRTCLEPITTRTILLLMYGAGLRVREVVSLDNASVDLAAAVLTIRQTKFGKTRLVPVGPATQGYPGTICQPDTRSPVGRPILYDAAWRARKDRHSATEFRILPQASRRPP